MSTLRQLRNFWTPWIATIALFCFSHAVAQNSYVVTDLGVLNSNDNLGCAMDVNNQGWTLIMNGVLNPVSNFSGAKVLSGHASINTGKLTIDLGTLGGPNSWMNWGGLNDHGQVVGMAETSVPDPDGEDFCAFGTKLTCRPFLWQDGQMSALPTLGGNNGTASDINNRGEIAGAAETADFDSTCSAGTLMHTLSPVIWDEGQPQPLPTLDHDPDGIAFAINDRGQVAGESGICAGAIHAIMWENGTAFSLPDVGGGALAQGINNQGQIVGTIGSADGTTEFAALWQNGVLKNLGTLPGDFAAIGTGINNSGQIVGSTLDSGFNWAHGFIYQNGVMTDLNTLFPESSNLFATMANKINESGQISGMATVMSGPHKGDIHAFLATPSDAPVGTSIADVAPPHPQSVLSGSNSQGLWLMFGGPFKQ